MLVLVALGLAGLVVYGAILSMSLALPKSDEHPPLRSVQRTVSAQTGSLARAQPPA